MYLAQLALHGFFLHRFLHYQQARLQNHELIVLGLVQYQSLIYQLGLYLKSYLLMHQYRMLVAALQCLI